MTSSVVLIEMKKAVMLMLDESIPILWLKYWELSLEEAGVCKMDTSETPLILTSEIRTPP